MAGDQADDLAPGGLAGQDARGRVLEHEDLLGRVVEGEVVPAEFVTSWVGLAVGDGLSGDEVFWAREGEGREPLW